MYMRLFTLHCADTDYWSVRETDYPVQMLLACVLPAGREDGKLNRALAEATAGFTPSHGAEFMGQRVQIKYRLARLEKFL